MLSPVPLRRRALHAVAAAIAAMGLLTGSLGVANATEGSSASAAQLPAAKPGTKAVKSKVRVAAAVQGYRGTEVCGTSNCTKITLKVSCKPKGCRAGRAVSVMNKDPFGDDTWRVVWRGKTNANGKAVTPWINEHAWYYTYCCSSYPNPIKVRVSEKKTAKRTFKAGVWSGDVSYRDLPLAD